MYVTKLQLIHTLSSAISGVVISVFVKKAIVLTLNYRGYRICTEYQLFVDRIKLGREKDLVEMRLLNKHYSELPEYLKDRYNQLINHK